VGARHAVAARRFDWISCLSPNSRVLWLTTRNSTQRHQGPAGGRHGQINDATLRTLERELDLDELRMEA
jgi:hypothetical protein